MTQIRMLDALEPPSPDQLIGDMHVAGAQVFAGYVYRTLPGGTGSYSPTHISDLRKAGLIPAPIVVPGNSPPIPDTVLDAVAQWGFSSGPVFADIGESGTWPPVTWVEQFHSRAGARGYIPVLYYNDSAEGAYDQARMPRWRAYYIQTSVLPAPALVGYAGWQYANQVVINGHEYDASVMDAALWPAPQPQEEIMGEWPYPPVEFKGGDPTVQVASQVNTGVMRYYVRVRSTGDQPASGWLAATDSGGHQGAGGIQNEHLVAPGGGAWVDYHLPFGNPLIDCCLEFVPDGDSGPGTVAYKVGTP